MNEDILKRLDLLAAKLSTTTGQLWHVLVLQAKVEAITDGVAAFLWFLVSAVLLRAAYVSFHKREGLDKDLYDDMEKRERLAWVVVVACTAAFLICLVGAGYTESAISEAINPNFWALKQLASLFK